MQSRGHCPRTPAPRNERGEARRSWGFAPNPTSFWHCPKVSEKASVFHRSGSLAGRKGQDAGRASPDNSRSDEYAAVPSRGRCPQTPAPRNERGGARRSWGFAPNPTSFWHCPKGSEKASVFHRLGSLAGWKRIEAGRASPDNSRSNESPQKISIYFLT